MSCDLCISVLSNALSETKSGAFPHHSNFRDLTASATNGCRVCCILRKGTLEANKFNPDPPEYEIKRWQPENDDTTGFEIVTHTGRTDPEISSQLVVFLKFTLELTDYVYLGSTASFRIQGDHATFPARDVLSKADFGLAAQWIKQCSRLHEKCPHLEDVDLPTRLLDVGMYGQDLRLVDTRGQRGRYVTLSHCWGMMNPPKTDCHNLHDRFTCIPLTELPRTFQDAVTVVRSLENELETRYLWIDCFCILQGNDTEAKADFEQECARMYSTFANATVTLCGPGAGDPTTGFLNKRDGLMPAHDREAEIVVEVDGKPVKLSIVCQREDELGLYKDFDSWVDSPLAHRAWIVQERLLSSRVLYFGRNQMYMECASADFYEALKYPMRPLTYPLSKPALRAGTPGELWEQWHNIIAEYTTCDLANGDDWLPALSGTANRLNSLMNTEYYAGIWRHNFVIGLTWTRHPRSRKLSRAIKERRTKKPATIAPPSWSWASCEYGVALYIRPGGHAIDSAQLIDIVAPTVGLDPYGQVNANASRLTLCGVCKNAIASHDVPVKVQRWPEDPQYEDWIYSTNRSSETIPIGRMVRDDPEDDNIGQAVLVMLLVTRAVPEVDHYSHWAGIVLSEVDSRRHASGTETTKIFRRVGLIGVHSGLGVANDHEEARKHRTQSSAKVWSWMRSGSTRTVTIV